MVDKRIDFNLFSVFYAVMAERSVTRAARRLSMTQPAVSNSLRRLRHLFQDELFIKVAGGVQPTDKAMSIWPGMRDSLEQLRLIAQPKVFSSEQSLLTFNVAVTDTLLSRVVPTLSQRFSTAAPLAKLHFHMHSDPASTGGIEKGVIDCALGMFPNAAPNLMVEGLVSDDYVCAFRRDHPVLSDSIDLQQFLGARHVLVKQATWQIGMVDAWLKRQGLQRDIVIMVNFAADAVEVVRVSDLVVAVPRLFVKSMAQTADLRIVPLPFVHERIVYKMAWHERTHLDPARAWLRQLVKDVIVEHWNDEPQMEAGA